MGHSKNATLDCAVTFLLINALGGRVTKIQTETVCVKFQSASLICGLVLYGFS